MGARRRFRPSPSAAGLQQSPLRRETRAERGAARLSSPAAPFASCIQAVQSPCAPWALLSGHANRSTAAQALTNEKPWSPPPRASCSGGRPFWKFTATRTGVCARVFVCGPWARLHLPPTPTPGLFTAAVTPHAQRHATPRSAGIRCAIPPPGLGQRGRARDSTGRVGPNQGLSGARGNPGGRFSPFSKCYEGKARGSCGGGGRNSF